MLESWLEDSCDEGRGVLWAASCFPVEIDDLVHLLNPEFSGLPLDLCGFFDCLCDAVVAEFLCEVVFREFFVLCF